MRMSFLLVIWALRCGLALSSTSRLSDGSAVAIILDMGELLEFPATLLRSHAVPHVALGACDSRHGNPDKLEAIRVFQRVANPDSK